MSREIRTQRAPRLCRGQADSRWPLVTTFHRLAGRVTLAEYFSYLPELADMVGSFERRQIDVSDPHARGAFLAYLRHHGFPTPLLDWTISPYIAAYFAYSQLDDLPVPGDEVSIYVFDLVEWARDWKPVYDFRDDRPHLTLLKPRAMGNLRQIQQQGFYYTFTNVSDIESHIASLEREKKKRYLEKLNLPVSSRDEVMVELEIMGITAFSLFQSTEGLCRYFREALFREDPERKGALELLGQYFRELPSPGESP